MGNFLSSTISTLKNNIFGGSNSRATNYGGGAVLPRKAAMGINDASTPLAKMMAANDPLGFSSHQYPLDVVNDKQAGHYMLFYVNVQNTTKYNYQGTSVSGRPGDNGVSVGGQIISVKQDLDVARTTSEGVAVYGEQYEQIESGSTARVPYKQRGKFSQINSDVKQLRKQSRTRRTGLATQFNPTTRITDSVAIYLPANVQDNYGVTYTNAETGLLGALAAGGFAAGRDFGANDFEGVARAILRGGTNVVEELLMRAGMSVAETLTSAEGGYELANKIFQRAANPYMEVLFQSLPMRTFTYNFTFAPRNAKEQDQVRDIIKLFRFHMAPELRGAQNRFFTLPSEFDIHYMYHDGDTTKENDFYHKIATCVLTNCNTDYTPGGVYSHADGSPVKITMALTFTETEMITKEHIADGF
jgi:hypothetical protein